MDKEKQQTLETKSHVSGLSVRSSISTASSAATKARAKAEAYKVKIAYAEREAAMLRERARIEEQQQKTLAEATRRKADVEADLHVLQLEREATAASREAEVYEAAAGLENEQCSDLGEKERAQRTMEYVQNTPVQYAQQPFPELQHVLREPIPPPPITSQLPPQAYSHAVNFTQQAGVDCVDQQNSAATVRHASIPLSHVTSSRYTDALPQPPDFSTYLIRREMVSSGLTQFDDRPENYWAWKSSFQSITHDLNLTHREELDLLTKWLGPESSTHAKRIRSVHVTSPAKAVQVVWQRLEDCYGSPEVIEYALLKRLEDFPRITNKEPRQLRELGDLLQELETAKGSGLTPGLAYLDTARGVNPIVEKLPYNLQERWITQGSRYKEEHKVAFPPFRIFVKFICSQAKTRNDPSFLFSSSSCLNSVKLDRAVKLNKPSVFVKKTDVSTTASGSLSCQSEKPDGPGKHCPIHNKPHPLSKCRTFRSKHLDERKAYLKENSVCYRCCDSTQHVAKDCKLSVKCRECDSEKHVSALHPGPAPWSCEKAKCEPEQQKDDLPNVISKCTEICSSSPQPRSCSKICLVKAYPSNQRNKMQHVYAVLDDQSNRSLAKSQFFDLFGIETNLSPYTLKTCSGTVEMAGRKANGFTVESLDGKSIVTLPILIECNTIPDDKAEIPTPEITRHFHHLAPVADKIPPPDPDAQILLLLGRDVLSVHKVREQHNGPHNTPYAQRLDLGWVIVGEICLDRVHQPKEVKAYKTNILPNGRTSFFMPCTRSVQVKEQMNSHPLLYVPDTPCYSRNSNSLHARSSRLGDDVFKKNADDEKMAFSIEDDIFLDVMNKEAYLDEDNHWVAPLPFRSPRRLLPNNKEQAIQRLLSLLRTLQKKPGMKKHFFDFMQRVIENGQAEPAPPMRPAEECWYLPIFGVYHPQKPDKIRVVFDSSAQFQDTSLNDVLLRGPDLNNTLLGVLLRFRKEKIAITADIEQMFYSFKVKEDHRNYLCFLWHKDNHPEGEIIDYRMTVHVFGNSPSPAVAIYGLQRTAELGEAEYGTDAKEFVLRNFYVDDGLTSVSSEEAAIDLLKRTQGMLAAANMKLHKMASNSATVMEAFPPEDRAKELKDLDVCADSLPLQRSLGVSWNLKMDCFTFRVSREVKPFTRRGTLSTVNSLYDPLGFVSPVTMQGKALVRELASLQQDWDEPLPADKKAQWEAWTTALAELEHLHIPRPYIPVSLSQTLNGELCIFSDASVLAIAAVAYLRVKDSKGQLYVGFVMSKSKLAPFPAHTVPRLELCASVLAVELMELIREEMDVDLRVKFYTDSRVVLGYIHNMTRRFHMYVANRVARIRKSTSPDQWHYVRSDQNPADHATRPMPPAQLNLTNWFSGPTFLQHLDAREDNVVESFQLVNPDLDVEIRPQVTTLTTKVTNQPLGTHRFQRFSSWKSLVRAVATLTHIARTFSQSTRTETCSKWHHCMRHCTTEFSQAKFTIIKAVQQDVYKEEFKNLTQDSRVSQHSSLKRLDPFIDNEGMMRVGGRIRVADLSDQEKHPLIIPSNHHIAKLLAEHYHGQVAHQGRHFTAGSIRTAGLWIVGGKRLIASVIHKCVMCRKLRGKLANQKMSDLPVDRVSVDPPFTHTGLDIFGPWSVVSRRTRGSSAENKRWAVIFSCLSSRAVHLEVIESMSTSSFINALRRFLAIRGPVQHLRSDRGTNFIGACRELQINTEDHEIKNFLQDRGCTWSFNAPHSSHMGGAWERMIGVARRILDGLLLKNGPTRLTHEVLTTIMAEVMAIMNSRPLTPISTDAEMPQILSPAMLLTQKASVAPAPPGDFRMGHLHKSQWRQVQSLADSFWKRWRQEYLTTLQLRRKWIDDRANIQEGDVILLKDCQVKRSEWPVGLVTKVILSKDNRVRKVMVKTAKQGTVKEYLRPIKDVVVLFSKDNSN